MLAGVEVKDSPVSKPVALMGIAALSLVQVTLLVTSPAWVPSMLTPKACICVVPFNGTVAFDGTIVMELSCAGGKNPLQLTARAKAARAARPPINRILWLRILDWINDINFCDTPWAIR